MILNIINEESGKFNGKRLIANGSESINFNDIDNLLKQTYAGENKVQKSNYYINKLLNNIQFFFHGNTHALNYKLMLDFLQKNNPQFENYENAQELMGNMQSFNDYYAQKAQNTEGRITNDSNAVPQDFRYPNLQNYYKISLD